MIWKRPDLLLSGLFRDSAFMKGTAQECHNYGRTLENLVSLEEILDYISWELVFRTHHHFSTRHLGRYNLRAGLHER